MKADSFHRQYLKFVSRLYELAAEFSTEELKHIRTAAEQQHVAAVAAAAEALSRLASGHHSPVTTVNDQKANGKGGIHASPLEPLLSSKELFPSNEGLAEFLGPYVKVKPRDKESRARLVARTLAQLEQAPDEARLATERALASLVQKSGNSSFVARWSKLIRGL